MSNKSGTSEQVISTPQGGGALQGIGETFSPDLFTGTGNFTVPIALPPGRNGFQPALSLVYSTGNGNGVFGLGWNLSIPGVTRKTSKGVPRYDDAQDTFVLSGAEDLVPVEHQTELTRYRPRTEGLFARIEHHHSAAQNFWQVWSKDGLISYYGTPETGNEDSAVVANPDPLRRDNCFAWHLSRTEDTFGNCITYEYERDQGEEGPHRWDQLYLRRIQYADHGDRDNPEFLVSVNFEYEDRPDPFSGYRSGFEIRTRRRCRRIVIQTHTNETRLVRTYQLIYLDQRQDLEDLGLRLPLNGFSLLSQVRVVGHDDEERLPALTFDYSGFDPAGRTFFPVTGRDLPTRSLASPDIELADLFGNGLPDILQMNGTVRYWRNLGNGEFDLPREMRDAPAGLTLADSGVQLIDANGNGCIDLLVTDERLSGYYPMRFGGQWDRKAFQRYEFAPSINLETPEVQLVDLTGDGVTDAVLSSSRFECYFNDPHKGWHETRQVPRRNLEAFPNVNFSDPRIKWGDMTGDGLQDIILVHDGNIDYWPNLGYGNWGRRVSMRNSPRYPYGYDPRRILIGDIDGDGLADIVFVDHCKVMLWINQGGNGWSEAIEIDGTPPLTDLDAVRLVDLLGTGISGVLWSTDVGRIDQHAMHFLDFTGGVKPYLLTEMDNHMGALTRVGYESSIRFYLDDELVPGTRWKTPLPFPVQVVSQVEVIDRISHGKLTTEYMYHHGYWDGAEREFRGFGRVEQRDTERFEDYNNVGLHGEAIDFLPVAGEDHEQYFSPPMLTKSWFHQGPIGDEFGEWEEVDYSDEYWAEDPQVLQRPPDVTDLLNALPRRARRDALRTLRGQLLRSELYAQDGTFREDRPYTVTESVQGVREESPSNTDDERLRIFFPFGIAQRTTQWERGNEPMTQISFTTDYDAYGQPRTQAAMAVPRGRDFRLAADFEEPYLATLATSTFAQRDDQDHYMVDRPARTESYEVFNDGSLSLFELWASIQTGEASLNLLDQTLSYYDGEAFDGLPLGALGNFGALVRSEALVLTEEILAEVYRSGDAVLDPPERSPYFSPNAPPNWSEEYPQPFREGTPALAGYSFFEGDGAHARGYFVTTTRQQYDFQIEPIGRGLLRTTRDPLGRDTTITYDDFGLFPIGVTDPIGLTAEAVYDYQVMQPSLITDPNGNRQVFQFTPLGLLESIAVMGKMDEDAGDTLDVPGTRLVYDFLAFENSGQPISVHTIQREYHITDTTIPLAQRDNTIESREYSDGFGRLLQTRTQAENLVFGTPPFGGDVGLPADQTTPVGNAAGQTLTGQTRVIVSGWQVYDNKGRVVEKYEPFYAAGWDFVPPVEAELGQRATMFYDPRGQVVRTLNPDGSEQRVIYGVPDQLDNPDTYRATPWEACTYDANDNAGRTHEDEAAAYQTHWNTPASMVVDALGRTIVAIERNGTDPDTDWYTTRTSYDIRGNVLSVTDALNRVAFRYAYDLANNPWRTDSIDAGLRRIVIDAVGREIERRDSKGALILQVYDALNRPTHGWSRDGHNEPMGLRQRLVYGDELARDAARSDNLLGQLIHHYDEAGQLIFHRFDFKGNLLSKSRRVIGDTAFQGVFTQAAQNNWQVDAFRVDWGSSGTLAALEAVAETLLAPQVYTSDMRYDGLNRTVQMHYPRDVNGNRSVLRPEYNRAGALERIALNDETFVDHIAYNAKGQRSLIAYGNDVMTRYAYDPQTFRLVRLRSERYDRVGEVFQPRGVPLQDFSYQYDLIGNITTIHDRTPGSGILDTPLGRDALDREFTYDAIYRLLTATGRECNQPPGLPLWGDAPRCTDLTRTRPYEEVYAYDPMGNMENLRHEHIRPDGSAQVWNRVFELVSDGDEDGAEAARNNRLSMVSVGQTDILYEYDANGNMTREGLTRHFEWNATEQMKAFRNQVNQAEPSIHAHYVYDAAGQRVMKWVRRQNGEVNVTVYVDGVFEHHRWIRVGQELENNTLHVMDDQSRIVLVRLGTPFADDSSPAVQYQLSDHLGSSNIVVNEMGALLNREEYTPYGETSFGSFERKRYRFTGKERDEESGLNYHGARYYAVSVCRWISSDPFGLVDGVNTYQYIHGSPTNLVDENGYFSSSPKQDKSPNIDNTDPTQAKISEETKEQYFSESPPVEERFDIEDHTVTSSGWSEWTKSPNSKARKGKQYGLNDTIDAIGNVVTEFERRHLGHKVKILDISKKGGGELDPHSSHQRGIDVDIKIVPKDPKDSNKRFTIYDEDKYSKDLTQKLITLFHTHSTLPVEKIWFEDLDVKTTAPGEPRRSKLSSSDKGHKRHFHIRFEHPTEGRTSRRRHLKVPIPAEPIDRPYFGSIGIQSDGRVLFSRSYTGPTAIIAPSVN
ncbi:hypothetical protein DO021_03330 [Desulfobacter hydrogenophilus]|uniref:Toxin n=1 Tax=Desulfobacter hydrogenophilus TaxID=2291 RepID=A0A328FK77_9BACT|nr:penicillin-insensitive murein endopeptidase [Desulfobacter hydrogenophilus]NDY70683.1 hypothetical protein [Desulfobacter hydrogenophilus]QBH12698.1 hypothetical protein EYB58_07135 [Desulfobacter hydrogenophilus]RAM03335.1 hypothetical protein DO021_03330 [Desulfobacter hydrogenophilus]